MTIVSRRASHRQGRHPLLLAGGNCLTCCQVADFHPGDGGYYECPACHRRARMCGDRHARKPSRGSPCALVVDHQGDHESLNGRRWTNQAIGWPRGAHVSVSLPAFGKEEATRIASALGRRHHGQIVARCLRGAAASPGPCWGALRWHGEADRGTILCEGHFAEAESGLYLPVGGEKKGDGP